MNLFWPGISLLLALAPPVLGADGPPAQDQTAALLKACQQERPKAVARQEAKIAAIAKWERAVRRGEVNPKLETKAPAQFNSEQGKQKCLDDAQASLRQAKALLAAYKSGETLTPPRLKLPPTVGDVGTLERDTVRVVEVVDERVMLVELVYAGPPEAPRIAPKKSFFARTPPPRQTTAAMVVAVRGVSTAGMSGNSAARLPQVFAVAGSSRDAGLADVPENMIVLEPFDMQAVESGRAKK